MIVVDTHALVWLIQGDEKLGRGARRLADQAFRESSLAVSAISFWEVAMLQKKNRLQLVQPAGVWRQQVLDIGVTEIPVTGDIGIAAAELTDFRSDPADRIIAATASLNRATLLTADDQILEWAGALRRHDARR
ncbi:MAG: type II toxin-antitoxin system VapC family toxin [Acidobacteria bacterium]|nr:MAG: type II toxin-antitoxin system VapC family toxin [Acidobacteriota bacterium]